MAHLQLHTVVGIPSRRLDRATASHCQRVATHAVRFAGRLGFGVEDVELIRTGALLHDVGKVALPLALLRKPGPLDSAEWTEMRKHPIVGEHITTAMGLPEATNEIVRHHHERWDGTGYPDRLSGEEIPLHARIVSIVDVFDALRSDRSYRPRFSVRDALAIMEEDAGRLFDPDLLDIFLTLENARPALLERAA